MKHVLTSRARRVIAAAALVVTAGAVTGGAVSANAQSTKRSATRFQLFPNLAQQNCFAAPGASPTAVAEVKRGDDNDTMTLHVSHLKPNLAFDVFTVEKSPQLANGSPNPAFGGNFGFAWYQSDLETDAHGEGEIKIKTILLDQIFGFDASRGVTPVDTFNVGFWFNNPADAAACGFTGTTPFNGEHAAGPLAMVTRLNADTKLGPLCTSPQANGDGTFHCNP